MPRKHSAGGDNQSSGDFKKCVAAIKLKKASDSIKKTNQTKRVGIVK